jgi:hypothetical protein
VVLSLLLSSLSQLLSVLSDSQLVAVLVLLLLPSVLVLLVALLSQSSLLISQPVPSKELLLSSFGAANARRGVIFVVVNADGAHAVIARPSTKNRKKINALLFCCKFGIFLPKQYLEMLILKILANYADNNFI